MLKIETSQKHKVILLVLLFVLNLILRIPSIPHEKGRDSFMIHSLAHSITFFGEANWWQNWLSVFGLYPYSMASAVPFSLSGMEQLIGVDMEKIILLFSIIIGLLSMFIAFVLAGVVYDDFLFKYVMALFYSTASGIMLFSTWEISSRGPFMILMVLYIFVLLKNIPPIKKTCILLVLGILLAATHHYFYFLIPLTIIFIVIKFLPIIKLDFARSQYLNYLYLCVLIVVLMLPFVTRMQIEGGSRYVWLADMMVINARFIGPALVLVPIGLIYLIMKNNKKVEEWYFLCALLLMIPFMYNLTYGVYISLLFMIFFIAVAFRNSLDTVSRSKAYKIILIFAVFSIIFFSGFYNHYRTGQYAHIWYMDEKTYTTGQWIDLYISNDTHMLSNSIDHHKIRIISQQSDGCPIFIGGVLGLTYGYINDDFADNLEKMPFTSSYFYFEGPYKLIGKDPFSAMGWNLAVRDIKQVKARYNFDYLLQSSYVPQPIGFTENMKERIYADGLFEIYDARNI